MSSACAGQHFCREGSFKEAGLLKTNLIQLLEDIKIKTEHVPGGLFKNCSVIQFWRAAPGHNAALT